MPLPPATGKAPDRRRAGFLFGVLAAFCLLAGALSSHGFLGDVGWDVANGLWILGHGYVPLHNWLTVAMHGAPWANSEWLFGLYTGLLYRAGGRVLVFLGLMPLLLLLALLLATGARRLGAYWEILWPLAGALTVVPLASPRPQLVSYLLFAFALYAVAVAREGRPKLLWAAAATGLLWVQTHGSAVLLPLVLGLEWLFAAGTPRKALVWPLVGSVLLLAARPGGIVSVLSNIGHVGSKGNVNVIGEWASPNFHEPWAWMALAVLFLALTLLAPALKRKRRYADLILLLGTAAAMLYAARFLPYFTLVVALRAPEYVPQRWTVRGRAPAARSAWLGALVVAALAVTFGRLPVFPQRAPMRAIDWLRRSHAQNVFNWYSIGASLEPYGIRPYLDGRDNLWLQRGWWPQYLAVAYGRESVLTFLQQHDPSARYVLWYLHSPVGLVLDRSPHWRRVVVDENLQDPLRGQMGPYAVWQRVD